MLTCKDLDLKFILHNTSNNALVFNENIDFCSGEEFHIIHYTIDTTSNKKILGSLCYNERESMLVGIQYRPLIWFDYEQMMQLPSIDDTTAISVSSNNYQGNGRLNNSLLQQQINLNMANSELKEYVHYEINPIIQKNGELKHLILEHEEWFEIIWWHNLRTMNWRHFLNAVHDKYKQEQQNISLTMGIMGKAQFPQNLEGTILHHFEIDVRFIWLQILDFKWAL